MNRLTAGVIPLLRARGGRLPVHFAPTLALALHQLLQGKLRVGRWVAPQTGGTPRGVDAARLALLPGAHGAAAATGFPHHLCARLGQLRAERLALRGAARAAEHHLGQGGAGRGRGEEQQQQAAAGEPQHCRRRVGLWRVGRLGSRVEQVGERSGERTGEGSRGMGALLGPTDSWVRCYWIESV